VLYYANTYAGGADARDFVHQIKSREDFESFVGGDSDKVLKVVDVSVKTADPCIHIYPAVLALAKNFKVRIGGDIGINAEWMLRAMCPSPECCWMMWV